MSGKSLITVPESAEAALFFLDSQYLFIHTNGGGVTSKFVGAATVRQAFSKEPVDTGWLPAGVNRWGSGSKGVWMVRFHPPAIYSLRIERENRTRKLRVPMPALVFFARRNHYYIWATRGERFDPKATLYRAPLANVNPAGLICFGKNPHSDCSKAFDQVWRTFWDAPFNDDHGSNKSNRHRDSINEALIELHRRKAQKYPPGDLVLIGGKSQTLDSTIRQLTDREERSGFIEEDYDNGDEEID